MVAINKKYLPWFMWFPPLLFFAYQFVMRLAPGLVMPEIMNKFHIDATAFGVLSSMYYYGYAGMQIPVALMLDRLGVRFVTSICVFLCALSTIAFVYTDSWIIVLIARFLIGACSAAGFLSVSKVISQWFPSEKYGRMVGITFTFGLIGALYGGKPMAMLLEVTSWESLFKVVGLVGFFIFSLVFLIVRGPSEAVSEVEEGSVKDKLADILRNPVLLIVAFSNLLMVGSLEGFADVWGVSYLQQVYDLEKADASFATSMIFFGMLFGGPLLAFIAEKTHDYFGVTAFCGILMSTLFIIMLMCNNLLSYYFLCFMMFVVGILCCYQVLIFTIGSKLVPVAMVGMTIAFLNCINMLGGSFFHTIIGNLMDIFWDGSYKNGMKVYDDVAYSAALFAIPIAALIGAGAFMVLRQKRVLKV